MSATDYSRLQRDRNPMPEGVRRALVEARLEPAFFARPAYQQNDYLGWIARAKREATRQKRLAQMLAELRGGERYMKMVYRPQAEPLTGLRQGAAKPKPRRAR